MDGVIDLNDLHNYENQYIPSYVRNDFTPPDNQLTDEIATLGRVLFYDKKLSLNESISCASCHKQEFAFGDTSIVSLGFDGKPTERHSIRLMNLSHGDMPQVFWDARAEQLEDQPAMTIANSIEMGFSGEAGQPRIDSLLRRLDKVTYYEDLFELAYGDKIINVERLERALAQFVRSIVSFDSKFDEGLESGVGVFSDFPNFTELENYGRFLFFSPFPPIIPDFIPLPDSVQFFGCGNCHTNPNLSQSIAFEGNNGVTGVAGDTLAKDFTAVRSPSLRNMFTPDGKEIGPFMHDGSLEDLDAVLEHYSLIPFDEDNTNISIGVSSGLFESSTNRPMSDYQVLALKAFMKTFSGTDVFTNPKWSDPYDENGNLIVLPLCNGDTVFEEVIYSICEGEEIDGYNVTGVYVDTLTAVTGCDSIRTLDLTVFQDVIMEVSEVICSEDAHAPYTETGIYTESYTAVNGCDSIFILNLTVMEEISFTELISICEGENHNGYDTTGIYSEILVAANGCDSTYILDLEVLDPSDPACDMVATAEIDLFSLEIYPNPASEFINIRTRSNHSMVLTIYNSIGEPLQVTDIKSSLHRFDLHPLPEGVFIVEVYDPQTNYKELVTLIKS